MKTYRFEVRLSVRFEAESGEDAGRVADATLDRLIGVAPSIEQAGVSEATLFDEQGQMVLRPQSVCAEPLVNGSVCGEPATEIVGSDGLGYYPACPDHAQAWSDRSHYPRDEAPEE